MQLHALVTHEPPWYVARCVEVEAAAQGATADEATANLTAALTLVDPPVAASGSPSVVRPIEVPLGEAPSAGEAGGVDRDSLLRRLEVHGWVMVVVPGNHDVLRGPGGTPILALPPGAEQIAPGVVRLAGAAAVTAGAPATRASGALARLDALFARHPHADDTTLLVREQRDAG